ncbi:ferric-chelate reductase [Trichosporon asahii var. asahii CBS 2479]|uniref:ferric-chelate reductase (NADPH) n=1 Tax=Trichosporon asahii var. asahii (strain ATCC 90039 / CBS 2479 / JCM 2466 / KCTC 7840 / NBRC 103889/ NCYC 2677 / UAMH 7654) TaxID=1186058 RepID=J5SEG8_TRIAS|nr:ferric-chelate reductase [Trichosporon asahii var. asahii CBS 2479]EJT45256.1 ferric-chelate reductase [Trichosporon asahii var. asahii CBS 2479]
MSIILPLSFRPVRERAYEMFLVLHILLAAATLILMYYHVLDFGYLAWIWACVGLWAFDRFVRLVRIALLSYRTLGDENTVARMTATGGLIRVSVRASGPFKPKPGQYYFLYEPRSLTPWENHPFTLASWNTTGRGTELEFLVAPMKGWTRRLQRRIDRANGPARMRLLLEGPYGHEADLTGFEHVLLVAGGSGITGVLPYLFALGQSERKRKVHLVWAARTAEYAADVLSNELIPAKREHASLQLHFTRDAATPAELVKVISQTEPSTPTDSSDKSDKDDQSSTDATDGTSAKAKPRSGSAIYTYRPEMRTMLAEAVADVVGGERLAVLVCGPFAMCDDLRQAVVDTYGQGPGQLPAAQLSYFEEAFGW